MEKDQNEQHKKIVQKIIQKFRPVKIKALKDWLHKVSGLSIEQINTVVAKFQSFVGYDEEQVFSEQQIKTLVLIGVAAQKGNDLSHLKASHLSNYKKHSFHIVSSKQKDNKNIKQSPLIKEVEPQNNDKVEIKLSNEQPTSDSQKSQKKQIIVSPPSSGQDSKPERLIDENSFKKKRSNVDVSKSPVMRPENLKVQSLGVYSKSVLSSPPKPKLMHANILEQSISTKMETVIKQKQNQGLQAPALPKMKSLESVHNLFQSQIQISSRVNKNRKLLQVQISKYHKFTEGWSTVVKYEIVTPNQGHPVILRRFSEFAKLHSYLSENYQGVIIPQLPPKQYVKGVIWSADDNYLKQRKIGLQHFLNKVLAHQVLGQDPLVLRFIDDQKLDQSHYGEKTYMQTADKYLKTLLSITKNTSQIKDYGIAYYSYMKSSLAEQLPPKINQLYLEIKVQLEKFNKFKQYIQKVDVQSSIRAHIETKYLEIPERNIDDQFKKQVNQIATEFSQARTAYDVFCKLKAQTKWYELLYETKKTKLSLSKEDEDIKVQLDESTQKLKKVAPMLENQMTQFIKIKQKQWKNLLSNFIIWKAHKN